MARRLRNATKSRGKRGRTARRAQRKFKANNKIRTFAPKSNVTMGLGFPSKATAILRYSQNVSMTAATLGTITYQDVTVNGMYDPDVTGAGHQPYYFDQYMALYDHYTVIGAKIKLRFIPSTTNEDAAYVGIYLNDDITHTPADVQSFQELGGTAHHRIIPPNVNTPVQMSMTWSGKKNFSKFNINDSLFRGDSGTNPTEYQSWTIYVSPVLNVSVTYILQYTVEYIVVFTELKDIVGS